MTGVTVTPATVSVETGKTAKLTVAVAPDSATDKSGKWSVDDATKATIADDGTVTGVTAGTAKATYTTTDGAKTGTSTITVTAATGA